MSQRAAMKEVYELAAQSPRLNLWRGKGPEELDGLTMLRPDDFYNEDVVVACVVEVSDWVLQLPGRWRAFSSWQKSEWTRKAVNRAIKHEKAWYGRMLPAEAVAQRDAAHAGLTIAYTDPEDTESSTPEIGWADGVTPERIVIAADYLSKALEIDPVLRATANEIALDGSADQPQKDIATVAGYSQQTVSRRRLNARKRYHTTGKLPTEPRTTLAAPDDLPDAA